MDAHLLFRTKPLDQVLAQEGSEAGKLKRVADEARSPQRRMPVGILGSLVVATARSMAVAAIMTGPVPYHKLDVVDPLALVLNQLGLPSASSLVALVTWARFLLWLFLGPVVYAFSGRRHALLHQLAWPHGAFPACTLRA